MPVVTEPDPNPEQVGADCLPYTIAAGINRSKDTDPKDTDPKDTDPKDTDPKDTDPKDTGDK